MISAAVCAAVLAGALALARAAGRSRGAELVVAAWCTATAIVLAPTYALAWMGKLERGSLAWAVCAVALTCAAATWLARGRAALLDDLRAVAPRRPRLRALVALPVALVLTHALVATWLLPSESWDGIWYHDTIVGFTIQSRSLAPMPLPENLLQQVNGFPRFAEMTSAFFVLLSDRSLIELPNTLAFVPLACASFLLARRATKSVASAISLAAIAVLAPAAVLQLRSTYVDVFAAAAAATSIHFATKPRLGGGDAILACLAASIHLGSKSLAVLLAPLVIALVLARTVARAFGKRPRPPAPLAAIVVVAITPPALALLAAYGRNASLFGNPLYPMRVDLPSLGIHLPGVVDRGDVDVNATASETVRAIFLPRLPDHDFADIRAGGYGPSVAWFLLPAAIAGLLRAVLVRARRTALLPARARAAAVLATTALVVPSLLLSPALWSGRYQLPAVAAAVAPAAFALDPRILSRPRALVLAVALAASTIALFTFSPPLGEAPPRRLLEALAMTPAERAAAPRAEWTLAPAVAAARERELGPGALVVFGDGVSFPSVLYDERFDNRIAYLPETTARAIQRKLEALDPTWVVAAPDEPLFRFVASRPDQWEPIGLASRGQPTYAFRHLTRPRTDR